MGLSVDATSTETHSLESPPLHMFTLPPLTMHDNVG